MCVIASLLATCRNHNVNPRDYMNDVISRMPYMQKATYEELVAMLPHRWKYMHPGSVMVDFRARHRGRRRKRESFNLYVTADATGKVAADVVMSLVEVEVC